MKQKQKLRLILILGLFVVSLGGWLLHLRIHPPFKLALNGIPFYAGLISAVLLPPMFWWKKTLGYAYVVNGMLVIVGTITMAHYSLAHPPEQITFATILMNTLVPDIIILLANFMLGKALFELEILRAEDGPARHGRFFRYPNAGWWVVHLVALSAMYLLGHLLWK